jgi:hypothetical protein
VVLVRQNVRQVLHGTAECFTGFCFFCLESMSSLLWSAVGVLGVSSSTLSLFWAQKAYALQVAGMYIVQLYAIAVSNSRIALYVSFMAGMMDL